MGRWLQGLLAALVGWCIAGWCSAGGVEAAAPQPAVWAARDADSTLYLFGTLHLRHAGAAWGGPVAEQALAEAGTVWLELGPEDLQPERMRGLLQAIGFDRSRPLSQRLEPERRRQLQAAGKEIALPEPVLDMMKPWLLSTILAVGPMQRAGYASESGVDRTVARAAADAGKAIRGLESGEEQLRYLDGLPDAVQMNMLYEALDHQDEGVDLLRQTEEIWENGDQAALHELMIAPMARNYPELYEAIFTRRNRVWADRLAAVLAGSGVDFVAVGAGHLGGEGSIDALLRERGFTVERLTPIPP